MQFQKLVLTLTGVLLITGCSSLVSLHPVVTGAEARLEPALRGIWHDKDGEGTYIVTQADNAYTITYLDKSSVFKFEARLFIAGDAKILDLVSKNDDPFQIPAHLMVRVWPDEATLKMAFLDADWLKRAAALELPVQITKGRTIITAQGDAVRSFLSKYGTDARAYGDPEVLYKER